MIECISIKTNERYAVKRILKAGLDKDEGLLRSELEMLLDLEHPHIVRVLDICEDSSSYYIASEFIKNGSLNDMLERNAKVASLKEADIANIINQVLLGLNFLHTLKFPIVQYDLKAENVMIDIEMQDG